MPIEELGRMVLQVPLDVRYACSFIVVTENLDKERTILFSWHFMAHFRPQLRERRERLCQRCFDLLQLKPSKDSNKRLGITQYVMQQ